MIVLLVCWRLFLKDLRIVKRLVNVMFERNQEPKEEQEPLTMENKKGELQI